MCTLTYFCYYLQTQAVPKRAKCRVDDRKPKKGDERYSEAPSIAGQSHRSQDEYMNPADFLPNQALAVSPRRRWTVEKMSVDESLYMTPIEMMQRQSPRQPQIIKSKSLRYSQQRSHYLPGVKEENAAQMLRPNPMPRTRLIDLRLNQGENKQGTESSNNNDLIYETIRSPRRQSSALEEAKARARASSKISEFVSSRINESNVNVNRIPAQPSQRDSKLNVVSPARVKWGEARQSSKLPSEGTVAQSLGTSQHQRRKAHVSQCRFELFTGSKAHVEGRRDEKKENDEGERRSREARGFTGVADASKKCKVSYINKQYIDPSSSMHDEVIFERCEDLSQEDDDGRDASLEMSDNSLASIERDSLDIQDIPNTMHAYVHWSDAELDDTQYSSEELSDELSDEESITQSSSESSSSEPSSSEQSISSTASERSASSYNAEGQQFSTEYGRETEDSLVREKKETEKTAKKMKEVCKELEEKFTGDDEQEAAEGKK